MSESEHSPGRRTLLHLAGAAAAGASVGGTAARAANRSAANGTQVGGLRTGMIGYMLPHEQFTVPELAKIGSHASQAGFDLLANSDHFQPWQANQGHAAAAWITMAATGAHAPKAWLGTTVTCPTFRYSPAVVAQVFASLSHLYPGRVFLGVGSGEALNEQAATGAWPKWQERWDRLIEAMEIIRALWSGDDVSHKGRFYTVDAKLYDPPARPIPLLSAVNGKKSMRLACKYAEGLVTDPLTWKKHKAEWEAGAKEAGKDPSNMPVLVEQYVVVGGQSEVRQAAELWRFGPKAFKGYFNIPEPADIQRAAENEVSIEKWSRVGRLALTLRRISPRCESYGRVALRSLTFTPGRPTSGRSLISTAPRCCPRSEEHKLAAWLIRNLTFPVDKGAQHDIPYDWGHCRAGPTCAACDGADADTAELGCGSSGTDRREERASRKIHRR